MLGERLGEGQRKEGDKDQDNEAKRDLFKG
jgi:hypothetical protein